MFPFFESIRIMAGKAVNLDLHQKRINRTFSKFYPHEPGFALNTLISGVTYPHNFSGKLRFLYSSVGWKMEYEEYHPMRFSAFALIRADQINYSYKFSERLFFEQSKKCLPDLHEAILVKNGYLTDASAYNLALFNGGEWHTPTNALLAGTMRESLLTQEVLLPRDIKTSDLVHYRKFKLINALNPFETATEYDINLIYNKL